MRCFYASLCFQSQDSRFSVSDECLVLFSGEYISIWISVACVATVYLHIHVHVCVIWKNHMYLLMYCNIPVCNFGPFLSSAER